MSGKGRWAYNKAPTNEKLRELGSLSREGDKNEFVDVRRTCKRTGHRYTSKYVTNLSYTLFLR